MESKTKSVENTIKFDLSRTNDGRDLFEEIIKDNKWIKNTIKPDIICLSGPLAEENVEDFRDSKALINRYPKAHIFSRKKELAEIFIQMEKYFPGELLFFPKTFLYPEDKSSLEFALKNNNGPHKRTYILKPSAGTKGEGIQLFQTKLELIRALSSETTNEFVIQEYIENPLLIDNKKFDIRVYVLLSGVNPMKCFISTEGLARFCTVNKINT